MFGSRSGENWAKFRGEDYNAELHISLRDAATTHQHTLNVNGKNVRITVPPVLPMVQMDKTEGP